MNEEDGTHLNTEVKMGPDLVLQELVTEAETVIETEMETEAVIETETENVTVIGTETETGTVMKPESETGKVIEMKSGAEIETETGTVIETETENETVIGIETETETVIETETETGTVIETETETGTVIETETETGTVIETETETGTVIGTETETGTVKGTETETGTVIGTEIETDTGAVIGTETETETVTGTETEPGAVIRTEIETETEAVIGTETETGTVTGTETEAGAVIRTEIETDTGAVIETETDTGTVIRTEIEIEAGAVMETESETGKVMDIETETETGTVIDIESETRTDMERVATVNIPEPDVSEPQEPIEINPEVYTDSVKEDEVITIVTQESEGEIYIYERNEADAVQNENTCNFIEVCDSNKDFESVSNCESKEDTSVEITVDEIDEKEQEVVIDEDEEEEEEEVVEVEESSKCKNGEDIDLSTETNEGNGEVENDNKEIEVCEIVEDKVSENVEGKNYKNVILEDWEVEAPHLVDNHESENCVETIVVAEEAPESQIIETQDETSYNNDSCTVVEVTEENEVVHVNKEQKKEGNENSVSEPPKENSTTELEGEILKLMSERKVDTLKYSKTITKNDIVKILDESTDKVVRPIVAKKDLFFSIELTKRLNQKLSLSKSLKNSETGNKKNVTNENESCNNNNTVDDRQKIVEILEADEIKDWKSVPSKSDLNSKENGNDMEISKAIKSMEEGDSTGKRSPAKTPRKTPKKFRTMDKELERTLALQQLRDEFPSTRKRSRTTKKVNHVPFLASTVLEKALTSPEVSTALKPGPPKRRPCYLPENVSYSKGNETMKAEGNGETSSLTPDNRVKKVKNKNDGESVRDENLVAVRGESGGDTLDIGVAGSSSSCISNPIVKTYSVKRKSTDTENNIKTTLETIAAVTKALNESAEQPIEPAPKKQKTVPGPDVKMKKKILVKKKAKLKGKAVSGSEKKRNLELEKLLGDEGAVRMLYETQHGETSSTTPKKSKTKSTSGLKKDLVLKTKLVKNAVMRLSGVGSEGVFLRGKRRSVKSIPEVPVNEEEDSTEPLFASTPNIVLYKPKKKQRAEASRILYRHSSSESFDSSEGYRRTSFEADGLNVKEGLKLNGEKLEESNFLSPEAEKVSPKVVKAKKSELFVRKRFKRLKNAKSLTRRKEIKVTKSKGGTERMSTDSASMGGSKLNLSIVPVRKSSRPRMVSKKYSIWSSTSMDSLSLGLKKLKKASTELGKKLNCKELTILQYEHLVQVILSPSSTLMKNSLNQEVLQELKQVFNFLSDEESCTAVLLSSTGSTFCQGVDLNQIITFSESERRNGVLALTNAISEFLTCLTQFKKPVIAGVHAAAVGLGVTLLPYCDLVICSDKSSFYTPYVKLGQAPEGAPTQTFPRISRQLVSELLFKSHKMSATDALKHGLVTQIIPEDRFEEELIIMSRNIAAQPCQGIQSIKFLLKSSDQEEIVQTLQLEGDLLEEHWTSSECLNNMIRFLNSGEVQLKQLDNT